MSAWGPGTSPSWTSSSSSGPYTPPFEPPPDSSPSPYNIPLLSSRGHHPPPICAASPPSVHQTADFPCTSVPGVNEEDLRFFDIDEVDDESWQRLRGRAGQDNSSYRRAGAATTSSEYMNKTVSKTEVDRVMQQITDLLGGGTTSDVVSGEDGGASESWDRHCEATQRWREWVRVVAG